MHVDSFLQHWGINENPFRGEEARHDPVFHRLIGRDAAHPDFSKVYGQPDQPSAAVVFGEKGSGKTALRLQIEQRIDQHNHANPDRKVWVVRYDDFNPILDRLAHHQRRELKHDEVELDRFRLADHMDAILSLSITRLVDMICGLRQDMDRSDLMQRLRRLPKRQRMDAAVLALLYDEPTSGIPETRWQQARRALRVGWLSMTGLMTWAAAVAGLLVIGLGLGLWFAGPERDMWTMVLVGATAAAAILLLVLAGWRHLRLWRLARRLRNELRVVDRTNARLRDGLSVLPSSELGSQPLPLPGDQDSRYQLTSRLLDILRALGYTSMIVLVDRVDEPVLVNGNPEKMQQLIWPMLNNKFLQQDRVGVKLLLPVELRHLLHREDAEFYQRARLDKQHLVDRLSWSGPLLYDLCTDRLTACRSAGAGPISLTDLFEDEVTSRDLVDALDQMHQPRDAFKFLYEVIHEHCSSVPDDQPVWQIPRLTLDQVRKQQSQRVQAFYRGLGPA